MRKTLVGWSAVLVFVIAGAVASVGLAAATEPETITCDANALAHAFESGGGDLRLRRQLRTDARCRTHSPHCNHADARARRSRRRVHRHQWGLETLESAFAATASGTAPLDGGILPGPGGPPLGRERTDPLLW
jgi:hypothetical protein